MVHKIGIILVMSSVYQALDCMECTHNKLMKHNGNITCANNYQ